MVIGQARKAVECVWCREGVEKGTFIARIGSQPYHLRCGEAYLREVMKGVSRKALDTHVSHVVCGFVLGAIKKIKRFL